MVIHSKESVPDDIVELCMYDLNITLTTSKKERKKEKVAKTAHHTLTVHEGHNMETWVDMDCDWPDMCGG